MTNDLYFLSYPSNHLLKEVIINILFILKSHNLLKSYYQNVEGYGNVLVCFVRPYVVSQVNVG
jgi:hypothetical protein